MASANLQSRISLDATQFQAGLRAASASAKKFAGGVKGGLQSVATATVNVIGTIAKLGVAFGVAGAAAAAMGLKKAFDLGGVLSDFSARTGVAVSQLIVMQRALEDNGIAGDKVANILNKMQKSIGEMGQGLSTQVRAFQSLGLTFEQLQRLSPDKQFALLQKSIAGLEDPAQRATLAMQIFGRAGGEMLTLFRDEGALGKAAQSVGSQAQVLEKNAATFDRISDLLNGAGQKLQGFFVGFADIAAGPVLTMLEKFDQIDLVGIGQKFGSELLRGMNLFIEAWRSDQFINLISLSIEVGILKGFDAAKDAIVDILAGAIQKAINPFSTDTTAAVEFKARAEASGKKLSQEQIDLVNKLSSGGGGRDFGNLEQAEEELQALLKKLNQSMEQRAAAAPPPPAQAPPAPVQAPEAGPSTEQRQQFAEIFKKSVEKVAEFISSAGLSAGIEIQKGGETAGKGIGEGGSKAGKEIGLAGNVAAEAVKKAGEKILSAAEIAVLQARSGTELRKKTSQIQGAINANDPIFKTNIQNAQKFFLENMLKQGSTGFNQEIMSEVDAEGWTQNVIKKIQRAMRFDPISNTFEPEVKAKAAPTAKIDWQALMNQSKMGPTRQQMDPFTKQIYNEQRRTNNINNQNQQQLVGLNAKLGQLGLIGA